MQNFAVSSLAFLSRDRSRFVPELRWYPRSSQADSLVSGLLAGPSDWLAQGASSLIPRNAERAGRGVVVEGGYRHRPPERGLRPRLGGRPRLMVAQIEQSLVQISGIDHVRVLAGTVDLGAAAQLTPMAPEVGGIVGMSQGSVVRGTGARRITLASDRVLGTSDARSPSLGADGAVYALSASSLLRLPRGQELRQRHPLGGRSLRGRRWAGSADGRPARLGLVAGRGASDRRQRLRGSAPPWSPPGCRTARSRPSTCPWSPSGSPCGEPTGGSPSPSSSGTRTAVPPGWGRPWRCPAPVGRARGDCPGAPPTPCASWPLPVPRAGACRRCVWSRSAGRSTRWSGCVGARSRHLRPLRGVPPHRR